MNDSKIANENSTVKRLMAVDSLHSQTPRSKNAVNKAATKSFKGIVKRKSKIVTIVTTVKTVEANDAIKGNSTSTFECAVIIDVTKSKNRNGKINQGESMLRVHLGSYVITVVPLITLLMFVRKMLLLQCCQC